MALAIFLVVAGAGAAYATGAVTPSKPSASGVITGCANKRTGVVRIARHCRKNERKLQWNVRGVRGLVGPQGAAGAAGAAGANGHDGANGANGHDGAAGAKG